MDNPLSIKELQLRLINAEIEVDTAYIVLPPGHGKSYHHLWIPYLYEADSILNCRATSYLAELRELAKYTGDWGPYDNEWTDQIRKHLPEAPYIIMVPDDSVGQKIAKECIFRGVLAHDAWSKNLEHRKGSVREYCHWWEAVRKAGAVVYEGNDELNSAMRSRIYEWLATKNVDISWCKECEKH